MSYQFPTRRLQSQDDAAMVARPDVPRSKFSGSFSVKTTFDAGKLIPFHVEEVYPGDHFRYRFTPFVRTATPLFPIMDSQRIDIHAFFCPNRLVYDDWVKLMGQQNAPGDSIAFSVPQCTSAGNGFAVGSLGDYLGLPTVGQPAAVLAVSLLPFRAYTRICYEWFRDENLVTYNAQALLKDGVNAGEAVFPIRNRAKSHDYFTSCLPWPQKFVAPQITSPVIGLGVQTGVATTAAAVTATETPSIATPTGVRVYANAYQSTGDQFIIDALGVNGVPQLFAQSDINLFRQAMAVQTFLERMARGGTRYTEITENIFGVRNPDARLQRPEYIGGGSTPLQFTPIAQTAPTAGVPLGALGAAGTAVGNNSASYAATEHGFIVCILSVKSELSYSQGVHPMWDRKTLYDYYNPAFAGLGEQAVKVRQLYALGTAADETVFGYQERWHELRTHWSTVTGLFRPNAAGNIDEWHLAQQFIPAPTLGETFINDSPPMSRVLAAGALEAGKQYLADIHIQCEMTRPVPMYGTPASLGRF
ncbi:MAG TPA: phage capsid protein [Verrucomicrobia bacterium]|nr:phage capsid protein [Verrucomicrobiota bacterium]